MFTLDLDLDDNWQILVDIAAMECAHLRARYSTIQSLSLF